MKLVIVVALALVAAAVAAPTEEPIPILRSEYNQQPEGNYEFGFEGQNGIVRSELGELKEVVDEENKPHKVIVVRGSYSYPKEGGQTETINYFADETGFHATGDSIPKAVSRR